MGYEMNRNDILYAWSKAQQSREPPGHRLSASWKNIDDFNLAHAKDLIRLRRSEVVTAEVGVLWFDPRELMNMFAIRETFRWTELLEDIEGIVVSEQRLDNAKHLFVIGTKGESVVITKGYLFTSSINVTFELAQQSKSNVT